MLHWRILGLILYILGRGMHKTHYEWLGHYLLGSGKTKALPRSAFSKATWESLVTAAKMRSKWWEPANANVDNVYYTVGKAWVRLSPHGIVLVDHYNFYAICPNVYEHGESCGCKDNNEREWQDVTEARIKIRSKRLYKLVRRCTHPRAKPSTQPGSFWDNSMGVFFKSEGIYIEWMYYTDDKGEGIEFGICMSDRLFADKGKPFYTTGFYPITQEEREKIAFNFRREFTYEEAI